MKKYRVKKGAIALIFLLLFIVIALFIITTNLKSKSYSLEYNIKKYEISENYDDNEKVYYFEIRNKDNIFNFIYESDYLKEKKLLNKIKEYNHDNYLCIEVKSDYLTSNPLCKNSEESIDYNLIPNKLKKELNVKNTNKSDKKVKKSKYTIYNKENLLIWNYKGFNYIKDNKINTYNIFSKDIYSIYLTTKINEYLFIPNYEQKSYFDKVYLLNIEKGKIEEWNLKHKISFDSYITGTNKKSIYLIDKKEKVEYELVPHKKKMRIIATSKQNGIIYTNGIEEKVQMKILTSNTKEFSYKNNYHFEIKNQKLYLKYLDSTIKTRITDKDVKEIVNIKEDNVYYLSGNTLYKYNLKEGEKKLIEYGEWDFNYQNQIFIDN